MNKKKFPFEMHYTLFNSKRIERKLRDEKEKKGIKIHGKSSSPAASEEFWLLDLRAMFRHENVFNVTLIPSSESMKREEKI